MSTVDFVVSQATARTGSSPAAVRALLTLGLNHVPEGTRVNRESMALALEATRLELNQLLDQVETEFEALGPLKQMLVFSAIGSGLDDVRRELKS